MISNFVGAVATVAALGGSVDVPANIAVPDGYSLFLQLHAAGTQNYMCLPAKPGVAWKLVGPQATLFQTFGDSFGQQMATHFLSANPVEDGLPRPTWQHSLDSSRVWARAEVSSTDSNYVAPGAIPWLRLVVTGTESGPQGGSALTPTAYIQRVNTGAGVAPSTGCDKSSDIGAFVLVPYVADYLFYKASSSSRRWRLSPAVSDLSSGGHYRERPQVDRGEDVGQRAILRRHGCGFGPHDTLHIG